jgi:hypothetical protein
MWVTPASAPVSAGETTTTRATWGRMIRATSRRCRSPPAPPGHRGRGFGLILILAGVAISVYLTILKLGGAAIGERPLLLLGVLMITVGAQFLTFGLLGQLIAALAYERGRSQVHEYEVEASREARGAFRAERPGEGNRAVEAPQPAPRPGLCENPAADSLRRRISRPTRRDRAVGGNLVREASRPTRATVSLRQEVRELLREERGLATGPCTYSAGSGSP